MIVGIDGDGLVYSAAFACQKRGKDSKGEEYLVLDSPGTVNTYLKRIINKIIHHTQATDIIVLIDGGSNYREEVATIQPYKGHRDHSKRPHYYDLARATLIEEHGSEEVVGQEVDDELGILMTEGKIDILCTLDKDLDMIPGMHYNWRKNILYDMDKVDSLRFFYMQLLSGDSVDNIPGLYRQLVLSDNPKDAKKLRYSKYLKKARKEFDDMDTEQEMYNYVRDLYMEKHSILEEDIIEVGRLLWIRQKRDEMWEPPK